jgi:hypothetical protein|tara:strand:- start:125 stop:880 length:756 start_codon:yes stop_codon:yes gene_type:complete
MIRKIVLCGVVAATLMSNSASAVVVDLELQLLADVSGSVDNTEYALQLGGYESAFRSSDVIDAIESGTVGSIAVQYIEWSGSTQQFVAVDWFNIFDATSSNTFADMLAGVSRSYTGNTAVGSAINFGLPLFNNGYEGTRSVMDVSGDGATNIGDNTFDAREAALAGGVDAINGITIGNSASLTSWYENNVVGGPDGFVTNAVSFTDFSDAIEDKLIREIAAPKPVAEPSNLAILSFGLLALARVYRRKVVQ